MPDGNTAALIAYEREQARLERDWEHSRYDRELQAEEELGSVEKVRDVLQDTELAVPLWTAFRYIEDAPNDTVARDAVLRAVWEMRKTVKNWLMGEE